MFIQSILENFKPESTIFKSTILQSCAEKKNTADIQQTSHIATFDTLSRLYQSRWHKIQCLNGHVRHLYKFNFYKNKNNYNTHFRTTVIATGMDLLAMYNHFPVLHVSYKFQGEVTFMPSIQIRWKLITALRLCETKLQSLFIGLVFFNEISMNMDAYLYCSVLEAWWNASVLFRINCAQRTL